jgi:hypothetical protein
LGSTSTLTGLADFPRSAYGASRVPALVPVHAVAGAGAKTAFRHAEVEDRQQLSHAPSEVLLSIRALAAGGFDGRDRSGL